MVVRFFISRMDPHHYSRKLTTKDNTVYCNGNHSIIASKWCTDVIIEGNEVYDSRVGVFLHRSGDNAVVRGNNVHDSRDYGITYYLKSSKCVIEGNIFENNEFGARISVGSTKYLFNSNKFVDNVRCGV